MSPGLYDFGSPYRAQHSGGVVEEGRDPGPTGSPTARGMRVQSQCVLDSYRRMRYIADPAWVAGMELRGFAYRAGLEASVTGSYQPPADRGRREMPNWQVNALDEVNRRLEAVPRRFWNVLWEVSVGDLWAGHERMDDLRAALECLVAWAETVGRRRRK